MKQAIYFFSIILISSASLAQSIKQNVADKYYAALAYEKAAPIYAELAKKDKASTDLLRRAANSYRLLNTPVEAEKWYHKLVTKPDVQAADYYNYAQTLLLNKKYNDADVQMEKFYQLKVDNTVAKRYANATKTYPSDLKKDSAKFVIKNMEGINSAESDFAPSYITKTELIYTSNKENHGANNKEFAWDNTNFLDLYKVKLDTAKQSANKNERFDKVFKTTYHDGPACFSPDGKIMLITRSSYFDDKLQKSSSNVVNIQLFYSVKTNEKWGEIKSFPYNNKNYSLGQACFASDGKTIYFTSDLPGSYGNTDIWETSFDGTNFTQPVNLGPEVNTEGREMFPFVDSDNLLLFSSDGHLGLGGLDINMATLGGNPTYVGNIGYPLNTNKDDFGLVYDTQTLKGYFSSNREGGKGKDDIYAVKFKEPILGCKVFNGKVIDEQSKDPIPYALIKIVDDKDNLVCELKADDRGKFSAIIPRNTNITVQTNKDSYNSNTTGTIKYTDIPNDEKEIALNKRDYRLDGLVLDFETNKPLDGVKISILDVVTNKDGILKLTDANGDFKLNLNDKKNEERIKYIIHIEKSGYESKDVTVERTKAELIANPIVKVTERLSVSNVSSITKDLITIDPVFFDLDKSDIRPDAQEKLNKLIQTLNNRKDIKIEINSSTDCRATNAYNMGLSQRRAIATAKYLTDNGISKNRLKLKWTGENVLTTNCSCKPTDESSCTEEQHQQNRRSSFKVIGYKIEGKLIEN